jgi:hypothetical protein
MIRKSDGKQESKKNKNKHNNDAYFGSGTGRNYSFSKDPGFFEK